MLRNVIKQICVKCKKFVQIKVDIPQFTVISMNVHVLVKCGSFKYEAYTYVRAIINMKMNIKLL